jgi:hypothetical protein
MINKRIKKIKKRKKTTKIPLKTKK